MDTEELTPIELVEYWHQKVEDELQRFKCAVEHHYWFRTHYFDCAMATCGLLWNEKLKKDGDLAVIDRLENKWAEIQATLFEDLEIDAEGKSQLFDMASFYAKKIVVIHCSILEYFSELDEEERDRQSPTFVIYMRANAQEHPTDFRSITCSLIEAWMKRIGVRRD